MVVAAKVAGDPVPVTGVVEGAMDEDQGGLVVGAVVSELKFEAVGVEEVGDGFQGKKIALIWVWRELGSSASICGQGGIRACVRIRSMVTRFSCGGCDVGYIVKAAPGRRTPYGDRRGMRAW